MNRILTTIILSFVLSLGLHAQQVDPYDLSFGENLEMPAISNKKASKAISEHMKRIQETLSKHMSQVALIRNDEVVEVTIPCSTLFKANETTLKESGKSYLRPFLNLLKYPTMYKLVVAVHSDDTGETQFLLGLTDKRAAAINDFLCQESGQDGENVIPFGLGPEDPVKDNKTVDNRAKNRRVEIYIVPEWQMIENAKSGKLN